MSTRLSTRIKRACTSSLLALQATLVASSASGVCYRTPLIASEAAAAPSSFVPVPESSGYRLAKITPDPVLGQRWAMIASCRHPEWPAVALPANGPGPAITRQGTADSLKNLNKAAPVVRAGEIVRLWRQESLLRIEVAGVSEESGSVGKTIRVRLLHSNTDGQSAPEEFSGVVRGPSDVEIQP